MIFAIIFVSLVFISVGFIINERNAKYLLAGYNTMSEEERKTVDMQSFMPGFKKFHIFLGTSLLVIGSLLYFLVGDSAATTFLSLYPLLAYLYYFIISRKHYSGVSKRKHNLGFIILGVTLILVVGLLGIGNKPGNLIIQPEKIEFDGMYGEVLTPSAIDSVELVNQLPNVTIRTNGYAHGQVRKGYFKTEKGEIIKLLVDSDQAPFLFIKKKNGEKIYFTSKGKSLQSLMDELKKVLKDMNTEG